MHEVLSGERPDRSLIKRRRRIYTPPEVGSLRERRLVELCARCSEEDPAARPASAVELRREFEAAAAGRRFGNRLLKKQIAWAAVAVAALASLGLVRNRWTSNAIASSSQTSVSLSSPQLPFVGKAADWSAGAQLATFSSRFHCISVLPDAKKVRVIWGSPRRAEDVDSMTGSRAPSALAPETFADGCPDVSSDGHRLLFSKTDSSGSYIFLADSPDGTNAKRIVRGVSPQWLPNGQEFVFSIDSRHAAIFAISSGEMTVATDGDSGVRQLGEYAVNRAGTRLAIRYAIGASESILVVHALPSLDVVGRIRIPAFAQRLHFGQEGESVFFSLEGGDGFSLLHSANLQNGTITRVGGVPRANVVTSLELGLSRLVVTEKRRNDLWLDRGSSLVQVTSDGDSVHGDLSRTGDLVIQHRLNDGRLAVVLRRHDGGEEQITNGPMDVTPSFVSDGSAVLLAKLTEKAIAECGAVTKKCWTVHTDPLTPGFPTASPSGKQVAYLTLMGAPRIRLVSRQGGQQRDIGPAGGDACPPYWRSEDRIWVAGRPKEATLPWEEFDVVSGQRTGARHSASLREGQDCGLPSALLSGRSDAAAGRVLAIARDNTQLLRTIAEDVAK
jgi:hypothetical protein